MSAQIVEDREKNIKWFQGLDVASVRQGYQYSIVSYVDAGSRRMG
jgi:hypothetical protein